MVIKPSEVHWLGNLFLDPAFCTFEYQGEYYKAARKENNGWGSQPGASHFLQVMSKAGFIPPTEPTDLQLEGFGPIYHQYSEYFDVPAPFRNALSEQEAAIQILRFNLWLLEKGFLLRDAHGNNIVFQGPMRPYWCDLGSIYPAADASPHTATEEFVSFHFFPLLLRSRGPHFEELSRTSLRKGMSMYTAEALFNAPLRVPSDRKQALEMMLDVVEGLSFPRSQSTWGDYYGENAESMSEMMPGDTVGRASVFMRIFNALKPRHVVDMGANAGLFSRYMATQGAEVLAVEPDENAVLFHQERLRRLDFSHKIKLQLASLGDTVKPGDLAVALALTHHLYFTAQYPWKYTAKLLADCTTKHLLTEFMPHGISTTGMPSRMPETYRIELFMKQLERYFHTIEIVPYPMPELSPRIFILCRDKRETPIDDGWGTYPING